MDYFQRIIGEIEVHSVEGIRECFLNGVDPNDLFRDQPLINELMSEYARTSRFKDCVKAFVDHGLIFEDKALLAVLLDDARALDSLIVHDTSILTRKYSIRAAYTPLYECTLLHVCAEFNHVSCAQILIKHGAQVDAVAGKDEYGFGGQTPIFHTVNQNLNHSYEMLEYLLSLSADLFITVPGIIWGKGYEWETLIPAVNPISYAMMGLLPQMHRNPKTISAVVTLLLKEAYGIDYIPLNVPCKYLMS
jgi:hypothetical protein